MARIGFIGLGHMGLPMALHLIQAGHVVCGYDLQPQAVQQLLAAGGSGAESIMRLSQDQDVIITMLQTGEQVRQVCLGEHGLYAHLHPHALHIDCSTIDVESARHLFAAATERQIVMVDAPVSGGEAGASAATLTFMVGGSEEALAQASPFLALMGKKILHTGANGSGQAAKICNNMILGVTMIAVSEAFVLGEQLGLSPAKLFATVTNSSGQCWVMNQYPPMPGLVPQAPANRDYQPGFAAAMMLKDLKLSQQAAADNGTNTPLGAHATDLYQQLIAAGGGALDFSAIIKLLAGEC